MHAHDTFNPPLGNLHAWALSLYYIHIHKYHNAILLWLWVGILARPVLQYIAPNNKASCLLVAIFQH